MSIIWVGMSMRIDARVIVLLLSLHLSAGAQRTTSEAVVDSSPAWSPLEISGTINFTEQVIGNSVTSSSQYELRGHNISSREIVLIVATFEEASSSASGGVRHLIQEDRLFAPIKPGESLLLDRSVPGMQVSHCCVNPLLPRGEPIAKVRVQYVQFANGEILGDAAASRDVLNERAITLKELRELDSAENDNDFRLKLSKMQTDGTGAVIQKIREAQKDKGTLAARQETHKFLAIAEENISRLSSPAVHKATIRSR